MWILFYYKIKLFFFFKSTKFIILNETIKTYVKQNAKKTILLHPNLLGYAIVLEGDLCTESIKSIFNESTTEIDYQSDIKFDIDQWNSDDSFFFATLSSKLKELNTAFEKKFPKNHKYASFFKLNLMKQYYYIVLKALKELKFEHKVVNAEKKEIFFDIKLPYTKNEIQSNTISQINSDSILLEYNNSSLKNKKS